MSWSKLRRFEIVCGLFSLVCLAGTVVAALQLNQGTVGQRLCVAVCLALVAVLGGALLRREGVSLGQILVMLLPLTGAMLLRCLLLDYESGDYQMFLEPWYETIRAGGGLAAISQPVGNYNVPYLYFIAFISYLDVPNLYLYKLFSIFLDVILAWGGLRLVRVLTGEKRESVLPLVAFGVLLFLPTVVLNPCGGLCVGGKEQVVAGVVGPGLLLQAPDCVHHASVGRDVAGRKGEVPGAVRLSRGLCPDCRTGVAAGQASGGHIERLPGADGGK